jgi:hypothetical protein
MRWLLGALVVAALVVFVVGSVRGRVRVRSCCPDPRDDLRMRAAFGDEE